MTAVRRLLTLLVAWIVILGLFQAWVRGGRFLTVDNLLDLSQQVSVNAILAIGMTLVILIGGIDLSVGAVVAVSGVVAVATLPHAGAALGALAGLGVGAFVGAVNGAFAARTRMPPFIITLGTMMAARGAALRFNEGRPLPVPLSAAGFLAIGNEPAGRVAAGAGRAHGRRLRHRERSAAPDAVRPTPLRDRRKP